MENNEFRFIRTPYFEKYDETIDCSFLFESELNKTKPIKKCNIKRYVVNYKNFENSIYIASLDFKRKDFGLVATICNETLVFVNAGENIYYLASLANLSKDVIFDVVKTLSIKENCYIDITRFKHLFKQSQEIYMYKKQ